MGRLARWFAKIGAPGSTARWALKGYRLYRERHPDRSFVSDSEIFRMMIASRYEILSSKRAEEYLLAKCDHVEGLIGLVIEILKVEASLAESADSPYLVDIAEAIADHLEQSGLPKDVIWGRHTFSDLHRTMSAVPHF